MACQRLGYLCPLPVDQASGHKLFQQVIRQGFNPLVQLNIWLKPCDPAIDKGFDVPSESLR